MPETPSAAVDALAALRASGVPARDPVRWRLAEGLARRAAAHAGPVRRVLDDKLAALLATLAQACGDDRGLAAAPARPRSTALGELLAHAARAKGGPVAGVPAQPRAPGPPPAAAGAAADPHTVQFFKRTWSRLSADQRLAQSRAALPENAGPLNSQHLVHRALTLMHGLSPEYLERFVGYIDALQWLEQANAAAPAEGAGAARPAAVRRSLPARR